VKRLALLLVLTCAAAGCAGTSKHAKPAESSPTTVAKVTTSAGGGAKTVTIPAALAQRFYRSCVGNRGAKRKVLCGCIVTKLSKTATRSELILLAGGEGPPTASATRKLRAATLACRKTTT
jgi:hypothetical protein